MSFEECLEEEEGNYCGKNGYVMYSGTIVSSIPYESETWEICAGLRKKVDVFRISSPRPIKGVTMWYRMRNEDTGMECGLKYKLSSRAEQLVMNWYEHTERGEDVQANLESRCGWSKRKR